MPRNSRTFRGLVRNARAVRQHMLAHLRHGVGGEDDHRDPGDQGIERAAPEHFLPVAIGQVEIEQD